MCGQVGIGNRLAHRRQTWLRALGRLRDEASLDRLRAELPVIASGIEASDPEDARGLGFTARSETSSRLSEIPGAAQLGWMVQAFVAIVLLIACVNITNLQLARSLSRTREIATRMAIGAGRGRIVRQFVTESLLLTLVGGALGLVAALWGGPLLLRLAPPLPVPVPIALDLAPDWRVLTFGLSLSFAIGVALGITTAWSAARAGLHPVLKSGTTSLRRLGFFSPRRLLVGGQVALSAVLLVTAFLFLESLASARRMVLGFEPEHRLVVSVNASLAGYSEARGRALQLEGLRRLGELPGVVSVSSTAILPLSSGYLGDGFAWPEGDAEPSDRGRPRVYFDRVGPRYFSTMGATLLRGRELSERDGPLAPPVAVVNASFARGFWPGQDPIGKRFRTSPGSPLVEVVGVVSDGKYNTLGEDPQRHVYQPWLQGYVPFFTWVLKTSGDPSRLTTAARSTLQQMDPGLPITKIQTMTDHLGFAFWGPRVGATLLGSFALLGLALSVAGLYGVLGFLVQSSIPEIGVRMALGASPGNVLGLFLRRGLTMAAGGTALGLLLAVAVARVVSSQLYGVSPLNVAAFGTVGALLLAVAFAACYVPSHRAAKIDPLRALRHD